MFNILRTDITTGDTTEIAHLTDRPTALGFVRTARAAARALNPDLYAFNVRRATPAS